MIFMSLGVPLLKLWMASKAPLSKLTALRFPATSSLWNIYSSVSSGVRGWIWQLMFMRCRSCLSSGMASMFRSSGWPASIIWRSFDLSVSRLERSLTSSSISGVRFCASSMIIMERLPRAYSFIRKSVSSLSIRVLSLPFTIRPKSSFIIEMSCSEVTFVLSIRASFTSPLSSLIKFLIMVVLPVPTSPVTRTNPVLLSLIP